MNQTAWMDEFYAVGEDGDFGLTDLVVEGGELAVDVGDADIVEIDDGQRADA